MSIAALQDIERQLAGLYARQAEVLVDVASSKPHVDEYLILGTDRDDERSIRIEDAVREEVAAALRWAPPTAQARIDDARLLVGPLRAVLDCLRSGEITAQHARILTEVAQRLPGRWAEAGEDAETFATACAELMRRVLPVARRGTLSMTRQAAKRAVLAIDAAGEQRRRERARCTRDVWVVDELDGISTLSARMTTEHAHAVMAEIMRAAKTTRSAAAATPESGSWTIGEHRVHALAAAVLGGATSPDATIQAHIDVVIDLPTLAALRDASIDSSPADSGIAELRGSGPVSAAAVRDLLADPDVAVTMRRLVTDPLSGHLLDYGRRTYAVPQALRDFVVARDKVCRFPGCRRRADRCQIDHAIAWDDGGHTSPLNLGALCTRHHQLKSHGSWQITVSRADGSCTWRSPQGRRYDHDPPPF